MSKPTVGSIIQLLDAAYPAHLAQDWDVNGLTLGSSDQTVERIFFTVDITKETVYEALNYQADLIISHHPLLLHPVSLLPFENSKGEIISNLIKAEIALFNAHTNADAAAGGVNDALAEAIGLREVAPFNSSQIGRIGKLSKPVNLETFVNEVKNSLLKTHSPILVSGNLSQKIERVAICSGAGDSLLAEVRNLKVDAYLTSDLRHHPAQDNKELKGPALVSISHWASEWPWLAKCEKYLQKELDAKGFKVETKISQLNTDPWDYAL